MAKRMPHSEGIKLVAMKCSTHDLLKRIVEHINGKNITTAEGFPVRIGLQDVVELGIKELAKKYKLT